MAARLLASAAASATAKPPADSFLTRLDHEFLDAEDAGDMEEARPLLCDSAGTGETSATDNDDYGMHSMLLLEDADGPSDTRLALADPVPASTAIVVPPERTHETEEEREHEQGSPLPPGAATVAVARSRARLAEAAALPLPRTTRCATPRASSGGSPNVALGSTCQVRGAPPATPRAACRPSDPISFRARPR